MLRTQHRTAWPLVAAVSRRARLLLATALCVAGVLFALCAVFADELPVVHAQAAAPVPGSEPRAADNALQLPARRRAAAFLRGRSAHVPADAGTSAPAISPAESLGKARGQHLALAASAHAVSLNTPWTPVGPVGVLTPAYGLVTGRVTSVAIDPGDSSGNTVCTITSQYSDLSATGTVSLTVLTGTTTAKRIPLAAAMLLLPLWMMRRRRLPVLLALCIVGMCLAIVGCGTGRTIPDSGSGTSSGGGGSGSTTPTPTGSYTVVASATAAGVTHSVTLTLVVK